jgi:hypothetical protein
MEVGSAVMGAKSAQVIAHGADAIKVMRTANTADNAAGCSEGNGKVQRAMSCAEREATQATGMVRGGRSGTHYVSDAVNSDPLRARQRLALGQTPEVKVTMEVPEGAFSPPSRISPLNNMPGGGMERTATGEVPATIVRIDEY